MKPRRYAVIPTREKERQYREAVAAIAPQVDELITIAHCPNGDYTAAQYAVGHVVEYYDETPNISTMWNMGLEAAGALASGQLDVFTPVMTVPEHLVAVLNDDAVVPRRWFDRLVAAMDEHGNAALASGARNKREPNKICGHAFVLKRPGLSADERWAWHYSDDILQHRAEELGGMVILEDLLVKHVHADQPKGSPLEQISAADRAAWKRGER